MYVLLHSIIVTMFYKYSLLYISLIINGIMILLKMYSIDIFCICSVSVCSIMSKGIFAFYGVANMTTITTLSSYTNIFHMPYVTPDLPMNITTENQAFIIRMQPTFGRAMREVVKHFRWTRVFYIYDLDDGKLDQCVFYCVIFLWCILFTKIPLSVN